LTVFSAGVSIAYRLAAGALAVFVIDQKSTTYKRAAGALEEFAIDRRL